jgi:formylglycine-generating enzyme required for sulfatase activity
MYAADDGFAGTSPVGHFAAGRTQRGLDDIVGNVFEWTADEYLPYPGAEGPLPGADAGVRRVIRGGAFNSELAQFADPALRFGQVPDAHNHGIGFRCAADPKGEPPGAGAADSAK